MIPYSHLSLHAEGNYFTRYHEHPDETMVTAKAGSAVFINHRVFHGNYPNRSDKDREMVAYAYRPGWCGPATEHPGWDADKVAALPDHVKGPVQGPEHPLRRLLPRQQASRHGPRRPRHQPRPLGARLASVFRRPAGRPRRDSEYSRCHVGIRCVNAVAPV